MYVFGVGFSYLLDISSDPCSTLCAYDHIYIQWWLLPVPAISLSLRLRLRLLSLIGLMLTYIYVCKFISSATVSCELQFRFGVAFQFLIHFCIVFYLHIIVVSFFGFGLLFTHLSIWKQIPPFKKVLFAHTYNYWDDTHSYFSNFFLFIFFFLDRFR